MLAVTEPTEDKTTTNKSKECLPHGVYCLAQRLCDAALLVASTNE